MEGHEYESLVNVLPKNLNARDEFRRGIFALEEVRQRPLLCYVANLFKALSLPTSIVEADDLPFAEMAAAVPADVREVDVMIVTPGGFAHQVASFVNRLRGRFDHVAFIIPHMAMSAGTIWALSGDEIWMDSRAYLGPIDPQVPSRDGRLLPAQAVLSLLSLIQRDGEERLKKGDRPQWTHVQLLRNLDAKELGNAMSQTAYSIDLAADYLERFKFQSWTTRSGGEAVTPEHRATTALEIATRLCSHDAWKMHSHGISREVLERELKLVIGHPEDVNGFERELRRLWALFYWLFESSTIGKVFISSDYSLFRSGREAT